MVVLFHNNYFRLYSDRTVGKHCDGPVSIMSEDEVTDYYVVLADVVGSRRIERRSEFQSQLETAFDTINRVEDASLATPLSPMKGVDEFGCVLTEIGPVVDIILGILDHAHPVGVRFAISNGGIDVGLSRDTVAEMDGPAFHRASELLELLKENELHVLMDTGKPYDELAVTALNFLTLRKLSLTPRQLNVILAYERQGTQSGVADELDITQQSVSKTLRNVDYNRVALLREKTRRSLEDLYDG